MSYLAAAAHIRQLCQLALNSEVVMPAILRALHDLVPSDSNGFFWVDESFDITNICAEKLLPPEIMRLYFSEFYDAPGSGFRERFAQLARQSEPVNIMTFSDEFYRSEYYHRIWRHLDAHHVMYAVIRDRRRCLGQLSLYRTDRDPAFSEEERRRLVQVVKYIAHLVASPKTGSARTEAGLDMYYDTEQSGMLLLGVDAQPTQMSPEAQRLFFLASHPQISRKSVVASFTGGTLPVFEQLSTALNGALRDSGAEPPKFSIRNAWGEFVCTSYALRATDAQQGSTVGVHIRYREPLPIRLLTKMRSMPLSVRQKEVALLLTVGCSHSEIARRMHVKLNTVEYHKKQIYNKLDVHDQKQLRDCFLAA